MSASKLKSIYIYYKMLSECYDLIAFWLQERELKIFEKRSFLFKIVHPTAAGEGVAVDFVELRN